MEVGLRITENRVLVIRFLNISVVIRICHYEQYEAIDQDSSFVIASEQSERSNLRTGFTIVFFSSPHRGEGKGEGENEKEHSGFNS